MSFHGICPECNQKTTNCLVGANHATQNVFKNDLYKWTSGNDTIGKFLTNAYVRCNSTNNMRWSWNNTFS